MTKSRSFTWTCKFFFAFLPLFIPLRKNKNKNNKVEKLTSISSGRYGVISSSASKRRGLSVVLAELSLFSGHSQTLVFEPTGRRKAIFLQKSEVSLTISSENMTWGGDEKPLLYPISGDSQKPKIFQMDSFIRNMTRLGFFFNVDAVFGVMPESRRVEKLTPRDSFL